MERRTQPGHEYHSCDFMDDGVYIDMNCLREYEDTGLTPDQIMELKERDTAKAPEVFDGHWYKCPTCGMYAGGLNGNFCHRCGQRLKWEDLHAEIRENSGRNQYFKRHL